VEEQRKKELEAYKEQVSRIQGAIYDLEKKRLEAEAERLKREVEEAKKRTATDRETAVIQAQENISTKALDKISEGIQRLEDRIQDSLDPLAKLILEGERHKRWLERLHYSRLYGVSPEELKKKYEKDTVPQVTDEEMLEEIKKEEEKAESKPEEATKEEPMLTTKGPWHPKPEEEEPPPMDSKAKEKSMEGGK
jgi:hypothetical protein